MTITPLHDDMLRLRVPEPADIDLLYRWENDESLWPHGSTSAPVSRHVLWQYVNDYVPDIAATGQLRLIIELTDGDRAVGAIDLSDYDARDRRAAVGIMIDSAMRGRGLARRALSLLEDYSRHTLGLHQLWAMTAVDNAAAHALFSGAGFATCGRMRSWLRRGGTYADAVIFQKLFA